MSALLRHSLYAALVLGSSLLVATDVEAGRGRDNAPGQQDGRVPGNGNGNNGNRPDTPPGHLNRPTDRSVQSCTPEDGEDDAADLVGPEGQAGRSHTAHLEFNVVDPETGEPLRDEAWARMMYFWIGPTFDFVLNGHRMEPGTDWALVYLPGEGDEGGAICLGEGTVNAGGQLHVLGSKELDSHLPPDLDPTAEPADPEDPYADDAALALVPADDVDCEAGTVTEGEDSEATLHSQGKARYVDTDLLEDDGEDDGG